MTETHEAEATVLVVDDDALVLSGLARLLKSAGYAVRPYDSSRVLLDAVRCDRVDSGIPGRAACIVMDLRMPELDGLALQEALARKGCTLPIVFISGHGDVSTSVRAMKAGAVDFPSKPFDDDELLSAVSRALSRDEKGRAERVELQSYRARLAELSPREREVCLLVARGLLNKQIADELGMAERTVKAHRASVMEKLAVHSVADLVRLCDRAGVMD